MKSDIRNHCYRRPRYIIMTVFVMASLISIIIIARGIMESKVSRSIPVFNTNVPTGKNTILMMLSDWQELYIGAAESTISPNEVYFSCLKEHLSDSEVHLSTEIVYEVGELIKSGTQIMYLEKETQISKMSFDGREIITYILEQIYAKCGLELELDIDSDIKQVVNQSGGNIIFINEIPAPQLDFRPDVLAITLIAVMILIGISINIAWKKQLFFRGEKYDGFDEKEFA